MSVIRHNPETGLLAIYADKKAAGEGAPIYTTEDELAAAKVSLSELAKFYNRFAEKPVTKFSDKQAAAHRVWAMVQETPFVPEEDLAPTIQSVIADADVVADVVADADADVVADVAAKVSLAELANGVEVQKRGRKPGTGEFASKTVFALREDNPRRTGTTGFKSYEVLRGKPEGVPYAAYIAAGGRPQDLRWDVARKWAEVK